MFLDQLGDEEAETSLVIVVGEIRVEVFADAALVAGGEGEDGVEEGRAGPRSMGDLQSEVSLMIIRIKLEYTKVKDISKLNLWHETRR